MNKPIDELVSLFLDSRQAIRPVLSQLSKSLNTSVERNAKRARQTLHENDDSDTMYGTMVGKLEITCEDDSKFLIDWINPFAIITHASTTLHEP